MSTTHVAKAYAFDGAFMVECSCGWYVIKTNHNKAIEVAKKHEIENN